MFACAMFALPQDDNSEKRPEYELRHKNGMKIWQPTLEVSKTCPVSNQNEKMYLKSYNTHISSRVQTSEISFGMQYIDFFLFDLIHLRRCAGHFFGTVTGFLV